MFSDEVGAIGQGEEEEEEEGDEAQARLTGHNNLGCYCRKAPEQWLLMCFFFPLLNS